MTYAPYFILGTLFLAKNAIKSWFIIETISNLGIIKGWSRTKKIYGCTNEAATGTNKAPRNLPSCLFHVLLFQELHKLRHANLLMI